jgi:hypothetical protein
LSDISHEIKKAVSGLKATGARPIETYPIKIPKKEWLKLKKELE